VLLIGVVWPTVINLLVFGRLTRPREEAGIDLSKASSATPPAAPKGPTEQDLAHLRELEAELAARLARGGDVPAPDAPATAPAVPAVLGGAPLEPVPQDAHDERLFGARADDFYPTEAKVPHHHHPHQDKQHHGRG
jgi:hypothetical protein